MPAINTANESELIRGDTLLVPIVFGNGKTYHAHLRLPHIIAPEYSCTLFRVQVVSNRIAHNTSPDVVLNVKSASDGGKYTKRTELIPGGFWIPFTERIPGFRLAGLDGLTPTQVTSVIKRIATLYQNLTAGEFHGVGHLMLHNGKVCVGPISHIGQDRAFLRSNDYHFNTLHRRMKEILKQPSGTINARLDQYLFLVDLKQAMAGCRDLSANSVTYNKHRWLDTSSIFMTEDGPKILDWSAYVYARETANVSAYTAPFNEAFAAPRAFLHDEIYNTTNNPTPLEERLAKELQSRKERRLAKAVLGGRRFHRMQDALRRTQPPTLRDVNLMRTAFNLPAFPDLDHWRGYVLHYGSGQSELAWFPYHFENQAEQLLKADTSLGGWQLFRAEVIGLFPTFMAVKAAASYIPPLQRAQAIAEASISQLKGAKAANEGDNKRKRAHDDEAGGAGHKVRLDEPLGNIVGEGSINGLLGPAPEQIHISGVTAQPGLPNVGLGSLFQTTDSSLIDRDWLRPYLDHMARREHIPVSRVSQRTGSGLGDLRVPSVWGRLAGGEFNLAGNGRDHQ